MLHAGAYFIMGACWFLYLLFSKPDDYSFKTGYLKVSILIIVFGMLIEVLQGVLTTYRELDWADGLANSIGVLTAYGIFVLFLKPLKNVKHRINSFL